FEGHGGGGQPRVQARDPRRAGRQDLGPRGIRQPRPRRRHTRSHNNDRRRAGEVHQRTRQDELRKDQQDGYGHNNGDYKERRREGGRERRGRRGDGRSQELSLQHRIHEREDQEQFPQGDKGHKGIIRILLRERGGIQEVRREPPERGRDARAGRLRFYRGNDGFVRDFGLRDDLPAAKM